MIKRLYYFKEGSNNPSADVSIAVCVIQNDDGKYHRGISLWNSNDKRRDKHEGRRRATGRAERAISREKSTSVVGRENVKKRIRTTIFAGMEVPQSVAMFKSDYDCELTSFEDKLFQIKH